MEVKATLVDDVFLEGGVPNAPGSYKFYRHHGEPESIGPAGIHFVCPCGCGDVCGIAFRNYKDQKGPIWTWDGSRDEPTCTPSILRIGGCAWHGYLTDGVFRSC
jgi:hypothetical protein